MQPQNRKCCAAQQKVQNVPRPTICRPLPWRNLGDFWFCAVLKLNAWICRWYTLHALKLKL